MSIKNKEKVFSDYLSSPYGQPFTKLLTGKLKDSDGDSYPDAFDCAPNDKNRHGVKEWITRRKKRRSGGGSVGTGIEGTQFASPEERMTIGTPLEQAGVGVKPATTTTTTNGGGVSRRTGTQTPITQPLTQTQTIQQQKGLSPSQRIQQQQEQQRLIQQQAQQQAFISRQRQRRLQEIARRRTQPTKLKVDEEFGVSDRRGLAPAADVIGTYKETKRELEKSLVKGFVDKSVEKGKVLFNIGKKQYELEKDLFNFVKDKMQERAEKRVPQIISIGKKQLDLEEKALRKIFGNVKVDNALKLAQKQLELEEKAVKFVGEKVEERAKVRVPQILSLGEKQFEVEKRGVDFITGKVTERAEKRIPQIAALGEKQFEVEKNIFGFVKEKVVERGKERVPQILEIAEKQLEAEAGAIDFITGKVKERGAVRKDQLLKLAQEQLKLEEKILRKSLGDKRVDVALDLAKKQWELEKKVGGKVALIAKKDAELRKMATPYAEAYTQAFLDVPFYEKTIGETGKALPGDIIGGASLISKGLGKVRETGASKFVIGGTGFAGTPALTTKAEAEFARAEVFKETPIDATDLLYAVPVVGEVVLASDVAKATETLTDPTATKEEKRQAGIEAGVATAFLAGAGALRVGKGIKESKRIVAKETEKQISKELELLGKQRLQGVSFTSLEESGQSGKFLLEGQQKTPKLTRQFEMIGTVKASDEGLTFIPQSGGEALVFGKIKPEIRNGKLLIKPKPVEYVRPSTFEITGAGIERELPGLGATKFSRDFGIGTFTELRSAEAVLKTKGKTPKRMSDLRKQLTESLRETPETFTFPTASGKLTRDIPKKDLTVSFVADEGSELIGFSRKTKKPTLDIDVLKLEATKKPTSITSLKGETPKASLDKQVVRLEKEKLKQIETQLKPEVSTQLREGFRQTTRKIEPFKFKEKPVSPLTGIKSPPIIRTAISQGKDSFNKVLSSEVSVLGQQSAQISDLTQTSNPLFDSVNDVSVRQDFVNGQASGYLTPQITTPTAPQMIRPVTPDFTRPRTPRPVTPGVLPLIPKPVVKPKKKPKLVSGQGWNTEVKRFSTDKNKMVWEKVNTTPLNKESALDVGARETDTDISANFRIKKAKVEYEKTKKGEKKVKKKVLDLNDDYFKNNQQKFREFKVKKGKKMVTTNSFIEEAKYRLDAPSEKRQIRQAPRMLYNPGEAQPAISQRFTRRSRQSNSIPLMEFSPRQGFNPVSNQPQQPNEFQRFGQGMNKVSGMFNNLNNGLARQADRMKVNVGASGRKKNTKSKVSISKRRL